MVDFSSLPGISYVDIRQIDSQISKSDIVGSAAGFILATLLLMLAPFIRTAGARWGSVWMGLGLVALYKVLAIYVMILLVAHWSSVDEGSGSNGGNKE